MLQALLLGVIGAEIIFYVWLAYFLSAMGTSTISIIFMVLFIAFCWRLSHALGSFTASGVLRLKDGRRDAGMTRAFIGEFCARLISFNIAQPFVHWAMPPEPPPTSITTPVLLVHGYFSNRGMWVRFCQRLRVANVGPVFTISFTPPFGSIEIFSRQLHHRIEAICEVTGQAKMIIIAHSMGGLVARQYMTEEGSSRIAKLITLGSPHHGTRLAYFGIGKCVKQMRVGGRWLTELAAKEKQSLKPPTTAFYTINDDLVYPPESARLDWAENVRLSEVGHVGLLYSSSVAALVIGKIVHVI